MADNLNKIDSDQEITLPFGRASKAKSHCLICKSKGPLVVIPIEAKLRLFINCGLIIKGPSRCCKRHLKGSFLKKEEELRLTELSKTTTLTCKEVTDLLNELRTFAKKGSLNFNIPGSLSNINYSRLTGVSGSNFDNLYNYVKNSVRCTSVRSERTCLAIFLMKLRTGLSHSTLSTLFQIPRRNISLAMHSARKALINDLVPYHLGFDHVTRESFNENHTRKIAKDLFANREDSVIVVADATYIYIEKSSNYTFQRLVTPCSRVGIL